MSCSLVSRTRALFSFSSPTRKSKHSERVLEDEKAGIFLKERELRDSEDGEEYEDEEIQFPCPAFINTASKYIFPPTTSQYVPTPKTSSFSSTNHQSSSSPSSSSIASPSKTIDTTPLAQAFANLAVDAGIYGTRESYVEVLAFQLRRMVRSLAGQCMESKERCLTLTVSRPELNCTVHITIQTRRRNITHHSLLSCLNRVEEEQVVLIALNPLVNPKSLPTVGDSEPEQVERDREEGEGGVFSTWWLKETKFGCFCLEDSTTGVNRNEIGKGDGEAFQAKRRWKVNIARGRDAWWDLHDCYNRRWRLEDGFEGGSGSERRGRDLDRDQRKFQGTGARGRGRKSRTEVSVGENGEFDFTCERRRGVW